MPELNPVREPSGRVGQTTDPPRRFISTSADGLSGFWTTKSDAELTAENAAFAAQQAEIVRQNLAYMPQAVAAAQAARETNELQHWQQRWPDPQQALRDAHNTLHQAETALGRGRNDVASAASHIAQCQAEVERTQNAVEAICKAQSARLREQLAGNGKAPLDDDPAEPAAMTAAEKARRSLVVAQVAERDIGQSIAAAEAEVVVARRNVETAARAVCTAELRAKRAELDELEQRVEAVRQQVFDLVATQDYMPPRWPAYLRRLLVEPDSPLTPE
jgi:hypothetical protein